MRKDWPVNYISFYIFLRSSARRALSSGCAKCPQSRRPKIILCAVLRSQERDVHLGCWLPDLTTAHLDRPSAAHCEVGTVNGFGKFEFTSAWFLRDIKHDRCSVVPVHADGAGGWCYVLNAALGIRSHKRLLAFGSGALALVCAHNESDLLLRVVLIAKPGKLRLVALRRVTESLRRIGAAVPYQLPSLRYVVAPA